MPRHPRFALLPLVALMLAACGSSGSSTAIRPTAQAARPPSLAPPVPGSYVALGASETYGVGATPRTDGYAYRVARALGARHFLDVGIPGATVASGYNSELTSALDARPELCTVFFGTNDLQAGATSDSFLSDMHDLVATLRRARARVVIIGLPDLSLLPAIQRAHLSGLAGIVRSWNAGLQKIARQTGATFLDLRQYDTELAMHPNYISADGLHPSDLGHARLADIVVATIRSAHLWPRAG